MHHERSGGVVYLNSNEVFRSNMSGGIIANGTLALSSISGAEETTRYTISTNTPLRPGLNVLAVEVHQGRVDNSDLGFDFMLVGKATATPITPVSLATRWASTNLLFSWPVNSGWNLYSTPTLGASRVWTRVDAGITRINGEMTFTVPPTQQAQFFQLRNP